MTSSVSAWRRAAVRVVAPVLLGVLCACSSFDDDASASTASEDASSPDGDAGAPDGTTNAEAGIDSGASFECTPLAPRIVEDFDSEVRSMSAHQQGGGALSLEDGVLVASVPATVDARAYYGKSVTVPTGVKFSHARLRFTMKDLVWPPTGFFVEGGCIIELTQSSDTRSSVRLELRPESMKLDDQQIVAGNVAETGVGPELTSYASVPTDYAVTLDIVKNADATEVSTRGSVVGQNDVMTKKTPLAGEPAVISVNCGINQTNVSANGSASTFRLGLDDVAIDLCRVPETD
jgi:hypothetical protein